jgi:hypothetical protein
VATRGRPRGTSGPTHWWRNAANVAAHYASFLIELWLADAPTIEVTKLFSGSVEHQAIVEECWSKRGHERRYTVPKAIRLKLCELAIAHDLELRRQQEHERPQIEAHLQRAKSAAETELRRRGWTDEEIAAWFKQLSERARKRSKKDFKKPSVDQVFKIVTRRAPAPTLRRKARLRRR